jgi:hypothetical protein
LQRLLNEVQIGFGINSSTTTPQIIYIDNNSAMDLAKNPKHHGRTKHIDVKYHFIREAIERGQIAPSVTDGGLAGGFAKNVADIRIKGYLRHLMENLCSRLRLLHCSI